MMSQLRIFPLLRTADDCRWLGGAIKCENYDKFAWTINPGWFNGQLLCTLTKKYKKDFVKKSFYHGTIRRGRGEDFFYQNTKWGNLLLIKKSKYCSSSLYETISELPYSKSFKETFSPEIFSPEIFCPPAGRRVRGQCECEPRHSLEDMECRAWKWRPPGRQPGKMSTTETALIITAIVILVIICTICVCICG